MLPYEIYKESLYDPGFGHNQSLSDQNEPQSQKIDKKDEKMALLAEKHKIVKNPRHNYS